MSCALARYGAPHVMRRWRTAQGDAQPVRHFEKVLCRRGQGNGGIFKLKLG
jgi:hypothetical protein